MLKIKDYGQTVDIWALGCIFAELFSQRPLFEDEDNMIMLWKIFKMVGTPDFSFWVTTDPNTTDIFPPFVPDGFGCLRSCHQGFDLSAEDLLWRMLSPNPWHRPSCQDILNHPFLCSE